MEEKELQDLLQALKIENIPETRNYWLVRTASGNYFDDFLKNNYISINWDDVGNIDYLKNTDDKKLKEHVSEVYPKDEKPGYIAGQLKKFVNDIKIGDIVLIPSVNSTRIAFGTVTSEVYSYDTSSIVKSPNLCPFKKRMNVSWIKVLNKNEFNSDLYRVMTTHITISNITKHQEFINRIVYPLYFKENDLHIVFNVASKENIALLDLSSFLTSVASITQKLGEEYNIPINSKDLHVKLSVQSPGPIEIFGKAMDFVNNNPGAILILLGILNYLVGGKISFKKTECESELTAGTEGLLEKILKFKQEDNKQKNIETEAVLKAEQQQFTQMMETLQITNPISSNNLLNSSQEENKNESDSKNNSDS